MANEEKPKTSIDSLADDVRRRWDAEAQTADEVDEKPFDAMEIAKDFLKKNKPEKPS